MDPSGHDDAEEYGWLARDGTFARYKRLLVGLDKAAIERVCVAAALLTIRFNNADPDQAWETYVFCKAAAYAAFN